MMRRLRAGAFREIGSGRQDFCEKKNELTRRFKSCVFFAPVETGAGVIHVTGRQFDD